MSRHSVIILTTAAAGTGKTYRRGAHWLVEDFLPNYEGDHWSNFPLYRDKVSEFTAKKYGTEAQQYADRIKLFPKDVLDSWLNQTSGPWDFFEDIDLNGAHIAIDEIHNFAGSQQKKAWRGEWAKWLGEIRHRGATVEFISQQPKKIAFEIRHEASEHIELVTTESDRDPAFGVPMSFWFQAVAKFTGKYSPQIIERRLRQESNSKWKVIDETSFKRSAEYFELYDSYSAPIAGGKKGTREKLPYERMSWPRFVWWFGTSNFGPLAKRFGIVAVALYFTVFGGIGQTMDYMMEVVNGAVVPQVAGGVGVERTEEGTDPDAVPAEDPSVVLAEASSVGAESGVALLEKAPVTPAEAAARVREELPSRSEDWHLVLLTPNFAILSGGVQIALGYRFQSGPHNGKRVVAFDWSRREVILTGGDRLRFRAHSPERLSVGSALLNG